MEILVNVETTECADGCTVAELLTQLGIPTAGTALARNDTVVRKSDYAATRLAPGDRVEIIRAVAGG